jgi:hypothetical protein
MLSIVEQTGRRAERISILLPIKVEAYETSNRLWREVTNLESVSDSGAGFYLSRLFEIGQLLYLSMPIEKRLRRYDLDRELYSVWSIVRHCHRIIRKTSSVYHIGVAFIGPEPPASHRKTPSTIYKLGEINENGVWQICVDDQTIPSTRKQPRYSIPIEIYITICDGDENIIAHEKTVTENISASGASVFSGLDLHVGGIVKIIKQQGGFSAMAIVRERRVGKDNLPRLHLEFINVRFPLEGID